MADQADATKFTLRIEGIGPDDLPMRRMATYLDEFARLLGEEASTRFDGVYPGSARLTARLLPVAVPKVRARLDAARDGALEDARRIVRRLDGMLAEDNASGVLAEDGQHGAILRFPGAHGRSAQLPVITEDGSVQGELVRVGGRDETAHANLRDGNLFYNCIVSKELARALGKYLLGPPLRLFGRGRWRRSPDSTWELIEFRASAFDVLDNAGLLAAADKLRAAGGVGHHDPVGAFETLRELRED
ncbi:MAG TPA: hypothetical protein VGL95_08095 [Acetobacteraceae bacterium]|jgi:hypothetical protein